uniref:Uncharacterized protein n=1 Tax=Toxoplasma gondii (strain ATCC 50861 / VEG) TaxID=432359 RepID=A0A0F7UY07_TOXGV|nr:TPA: hypothetical protein BN1205_047065 [Toxoplasma gondii VEG]
MRGTTLTTDRRARKHKNITKRERTRQTMKQKRVACGEEAEEGKMRWLEKAQKRARRPANASIQPPSSNAGDAEQTPPVRRSSRLKATTRT